MANIKEQIEEISKQITSVYFVGIEDKQMYYHASYNGFMLIMAIDDYGTKKLVLTDQLAQLLGYKDLERLLLADVNLKNEYNVWEKSNGR